MTDRKEGDTPPEDVGDIYADTHLQFEARYPTASHRKIATMVAVHYIEETLRLTRERDLLQLAFDNLKASKSVD